MANPEHLAILKQGVEEWNKWREEHPDVRPDLSGADLGEAKLARADLSAASLIEAHLRRADLVGAELSGANLSRAHLREANLAEANLGGADLSGADLSGVNLDGADLDEANFTGAVAGGTQFDDVDLSIAKGLEAVIHEGPSTIGIDTIYKSNGKIPEVFLRGCGVPEEFIAYIGSMVGRPIEYYSCFISYAHEDKLFARRLHDALQGRGVRCWLDEKQMLPGDDIYEQVDRGIRLQDKFLLCGCPRFAPVLWALTWAEGGTR